MGGNRTVWILGTAAVWAAGVARAGVTEYPGAGELGTLLYEDNWPCAGDGDFNDLVLRYHVRTFDDGLGHATHLALTLNVEALGAELCGGLALRLPVAPGSVASASLSRGEGGSADGAPFGAASALDDRTAAGADTVIWLSDDVRADWCGGATGFLNTDPGGPVAACDPVVVQVAFTGTVTLPATPPWDLFTFRCSDRAHQIHASAYPGLPAGDPYAAADLFGTCNDASEPGRWYVQGAPIAGLPFAIDLGGAIDGVGQGYPVEHARIDRGMPEIVAFAAGDGHTDFYGAGHTEPAWLVTADRPVLARVPSPAFDEDGDGTCAGADVYGTGDACLRGTDAGDCDEAEPTVHPGAVEACNLVDDDCDGDLPVDEADVDEDGFGLCHDDCDDDDPVRYPSAVDTFGDAVDQDCDLADGVDDDSDGNASIASGGSDCNDANPSVYLGLASCPAASCFDLLTRYPDTAGADGPYTINPGGTGAFTAVCDQTTDGGGWTLIQRTVWTWSGQSSTLYTNYASWYATTVGTPTGTSAYRMAGQRWPTRAGNAVDFLAVDRARRTNGADCGPLYYVDDGGTMTRSGTATSVTGLGSSYLVNGGGGTATFYATNNGSTCVSSNSGVPWFYTSCCSTCPTYQGSYWNDSPHPMVSYIDATPDLYGNTTANVCGGAVQYSTNSSHNFVGVNRMEFFIR